MPNIRLDKGALIRLAGPNVVQRTIVFPYNPESLHHSLRAEASPPPLPDSNAPGGPAGSTGLASILEGLFGSSGAPAPRAAESGKVTELIRLTLTLDRADAMQTPNVDRVGMQLGLHPILSALELWLRDDAQALGNMVTLFVWGAHRILPVRLIGLEVHERLFDAHLNPLHASAHLTLQALDGTEIGVGSLALRKFQAHQDVLAKWAQAVLSGSAQATGVSPTAM
jgi:hypothetical protein